ncbi:hypothetical protein GUJ93_ZPchr0010g8518 [Zizania palustris]|uniref:Bromo domain-containing protein n=1 Tax=Zizania palustris TaxID=103762 RepID=A0A8J6BPE3_ZIZPA|nr:hypothetical protein GUJ93_ZPchr0010g8518 [Zizania palustris]
MKRKRGRKTGKKSTSKNASGDASPSSPSTEENDSSPVGQADKAPAVAAPVPEPAPPEPQKPAAAPPDPTDVQYAKPKVYSRVRLKFKCAKGLETHPSSSEAQTPASAAPEASKLAVAEKATVSPDGQNDRQALELSGSDKHKVTTKVASVKIKSAGLSSVEDKKQDRKADPVSEPLPSKQELEVNQATPESETLLEPRSSQELEVNQATSERQQDDKELAAALEAIKKVMKMDAAEPFNTPVDPVALGIPDYFDIIDTPMDFGTICRNLECGDKYMNSEDVYKDVQYIWDNCTKYNSKGDYIIELMKHVKKGFMKNWLAAGLCSDMQKNEDEGSRQSFDEKGGANYTGVISQEEHTYSQPNDGSEVAQHQNKAPAETSQEIEMEDYPIQQENHLFLQLCTCFFHSSQSPVFMGRRPSLFRQQRQDPFKERPLYVAITAMMKR